MERPLLEDGLNTFVRYNEAISILHKVTRYEEKSLWGLSTGHKSFKTSTGLINIKFIFQWLMEKELPRPTGL
jgi:hypothetical protein